LVQAELDTGIVVEQAIHDRVVQHLFLAVLLVQALHLAPRPFQALLVDLEILLDNNELFKKFKKIYRQALVVLVDKYSIMSHLLPLFAFFHLIQKIPKAENPFHYFVLFPLLNLL